MRQPQEPARPTPVDTAAASLQAFTSPRGAATLTAKKAELAPSEVALFDEALNTLPSPCGEPTSLRMAYQHEPSCRLAPRAVAQVFDQVRQGDKLLDIKERFQDRFACAPITVDTTGAHRLSRPSRPRVTVVEFIDHQCGHCAQAQATIERLRTGVEFAEVQLIVMHAAYEYLSDILAAAALAIEQQRPGRYPGFSQLLFARISAGKPWEANALREALEQENLDQEQLDRARISALRQVNREREIWRKLPNDAGTPFYLVNGCPVKKTADLLLRVEDALLQQP